MKYKIVEKANPQNRDQKKWYAIPVNTGKFGIKEFSKEISGRSSLTRGDVENVITNFTDELPTFLKLGMSVKLGNFGTLRLTLSSEGVENKDDFNASNIKGARVIFTPSTELKKELENISYEELK
ncbi:MAG: HU family DNA-binding protein [Prevotellaceae bacterium]|jgi:predicted histone-like DNA-binding protein|nr:HU family DNA-binding protein [Prevotellaceae bacterium]